VVVRRQRVNLTFPERRTKTISALPTASGPITLSDKSADATSLQRTPSQTILVYFT